MKRLNSIIAACLSMAASAVPAPVELADVDVTVHGLHIRTEGVSKAAQADVKVVIEEQAALTDDVAVTAPLADDLAFFVRQRYLDLGYAEATVAWEIVGDAALLRVEEGPRYKVGVITYEGNTLQDRKELTRYLLRPTHEKLDAVSDNPPFVEADLRAGAGLVQRYLQAQGYLDAVVAELVFTPHAETDRQDVAVKITEGRRYQFGEIRVTGEILWQDAAIEEKTRELRDQPFSEVKVEEARTGIVGIYQERGHFVAAATASARPADHRNGTVPVVFHVTPGPQFRIIGIEPSPDFSRGASRLARSGFKRATGKVYSPAELDVMHRHVLNSEVFSRLDVTPKPVGEDTLMLELSGEEALTRRFSAYGGYETFLGPVLGVEARKVNFADTGDAVRAKAEINGVGLSGEVAWLDPAVFNTSFSLEAVAGAETEAVFDYERQSFFGRVLLSRQWDRHISTKLIMQASQNQAESDVLTPEELGPADYRLATVGASAVFDYRDSPLLPTDGWFASMALTGAMSGDTRYVRCDGAFAFYQPLTKKLRLSIGGKISAIQNSGGVTNLPIALRLFNGGATSVRSFPEREMGQQSRTGTPLGGILSEVGSIELSYEIKPNLEFAIFGDAGRLSPTDEFPSLAFPELRFAVGVGLRYKLPVGPLRIDYGWNPDRRKGEPVGALHITFGFAF